MDDVHEYPAAMPSCPKCGLPDQVKGVSSLVLEESLFIPVTGEMDTYLTPQRIALTENLRGRLAAPEAPFADSPLNCAGILFLLFTSIAIIGGLAGYSLGIQGGAPQWTAIFYASILFGFIFLLLMIRFTVLFIKQRSRFTRESDQKTAQWQKRMETWSGLHYCFRDDLVFDPEGKIEITSENLQSYLEDM